MKPFARTWINDAIGLLLAGADDGDGEQWALETISNNNEMRDAIMLLSTCVQLVRWMILETDDLPEHEAPRVRDMLLAYRDAISAEPQQEEGSA